MYFSNLLLCYSLRTFAYLLTSEFGDNVRISTHSLGYVQWRTFPHCVEVGYNLFFSLVFFAEKENLIP